MLHLTDLDNVIKRIKATGLTFITQEDILRTTLQTNVTKEFFDYIFDMYSDSMDMHAALMSPFDNEPIVPQNIVWLLTNTYNTSNAEPFCILLVLLCRVRQHLATVKQTLADGKLAFVEQMYIQKVLSTPRLTLAEVESCLSLVNLNVTSELLTIALLHGNIGAISAMCDRGAKLSSPALYALRQIGDYDLRVKIIMLMCRKHRLGQSTGIRYILQLPHQVFKQREYIGRVMKLAKMADTPDKLLETLGSIADYPGYVDGYFFERLLVCENPTNILRRADASTKVAIIKALGRIVDISANVGLVKKVLAGGC